MPEKSQILELAKVMKDQNRLQEIGSAIVKATIEYVAIGDSVLGKHGDHSDHRDHRDNRYDLRERINVIIDQQLTSLLTEMRLSPEENKVIQEMKILK